MSTLPKLPVAHEELVKYISEHPEEPMTSIMKPYRSYEAQLRTTFAQDRQNPLLSNPNVNVLPLFTKDTPLITTRARDLASESGEEKSRYIMALPDDKRRPQGSPATVGSISEFQKNFNIFSESGLTELDWNNVVAAGSSVINCLLPVPDQFNVNKRKLREYYHEKFCPASDVDLFLYGLTHEEAIEKIKQIEQAIKDSILHEVTVVRTKYAITIASQYPNRHIQIVLRVYKSISEILTGFDIDAAGGAYDGKQVYVTPRALGSFITQINHVDLSRRSPSYENRLSKYSHRNFEVYWPDLDRSRVDPTIFERSFQRTLGLARLLVLERLPTSSVRETYQNKRRSERGRPAVNRGFFGRTWGDIKGNHEDEVADWLSEEEVSNYHTFTIPYGQKFNAKKIEKLCYTRDLLLNAEWNQPKERPVYLHRHPAFFGRVEDIIEDCCGSCPVPKTPEEIEVAQKEAEIYISGKISFLIDDPGRQQIGSFNPLTEEDWTDMAYVGNTARLCQSIVDEDIDDVLNWLSQEEADPNKRDYTGRTPLHLATMASSAEVVKCLIDHGARLTARLADGRTALHLAASRGSNDIIKLLMEKSIENEETEHVRGAKSRQKSSNIDGLPLRSKSVAKDTENSDDESAEDSDEDDSDIEVIDGDDAETDKISIATGSFVKVKKGDSAEQDIIPDESTDEPDYYKIDVLAWDTPCSPLHLAIAEGHEETVKLLCDYGADSILPIKFTNEYNDNGALLTLVLALSLPGDKALSMASLLLKLGAVSSQAETSGCSAFHRYVCSERSDLVEMLLKDDKTAIKSAINHMVLAGWSWEPKTVGPIQSAIKLRDTALVLKLLEAGANPSIDFDTWFKSAKTSSNYRNTDNLERNEQAFSKVKQPIISAIRSGNSDLVKALLDRGVNPNTMTINLGKPIPKDYYSYTKIECCLEVCRTMIANIKNQAPGANKSLETEVGAGAETFLQTLPPGSYLHWTVKKDIDTKMSIFNKLKKTNLDEDKRANAAKQEALDETIAELQKIEQMLIDAGAKTMEELEPEYDSANRRSDEHWYYYRDSPKAFDYKYVSSFSTDKDMSTTRRDGYVELMEAAWEGDIDQFKSLTLQAWGPDRDRTPLKADIRDSWSNSPFSVAFARGHIDLAWAILDIIQAQWSPNDKEEVRYRMRDENEDGNEDEYDSEDEDSEAASEDSNPRIVSQPVDPKFTIDDIGQVSMLVKSHCKPIMCIYAARYNEGGSTHGSKSIFQLAMDKDDGGKSLDLLLDMAQKYAEKGSGDDSSATFQFPTDDFMRVVQEGPVHMLRRIIKRTGAGIPVESLLKNSGVEVKQKSRYYQGLTVYGKKRKDWANAGRNMVTRTTGLTSPPLLNAATSGNIETVEFFLGDAPHRLYKEYAKSDAARDDYRLAPLKQNPGGVERIISKWLSTDNDWVLHCAILAKPGPGSNELVSYLIDTFPEYLEKKTAAGETPLMLAFSLGRIEFAKLLIKAGADQSTRNSNGENLVHKLMYTQSPVCGIRAFLELIDPELRPHMFTARKNLPEGGETPLHAWISHTSTNWVSEKAISAQVKKLRLVLDYSKGAELEMLNGAGDTCLHTAIMRNNMALVHELVKFNPKLLYRENAVGRTPSEVSHDKTLGNTLSSPADIDHVSESHSLRSWATRASSEFLKTSTLDDKRVQGMKSLQKETLLSNEYKASQLVEILKCLSVHEPGAELSDRSSNRHVSDEVAAQVIWDICRTAMVKFSAKRRLVSLNEANDVARRLGESHSRSRYFSVESRREDDDDASNVGEDDNNNTNSDSKKRTQDFVGEKLRSTKSWQVPSSKEELDECEECNHCHGDYY